MLKLEFKNIIYNSSCFLKNILLSLRLFQLAFRKVYATSGG